MKFIKRFLPVIILVISLRSAANEGMWLPFLLENLNEKEMKAMGMKISAKDIYDINKGSLKDAIVSFGGFCTGELISQQGLVLTNHHCGFDAIQNHSTLDRNYIRDGFWAMSKALELPNPGLFVTFIVRIEDVSARILQGVTPSMTESQRQSAIDRNINQARTGIKMESYQSGFIRAFYEGNQYFLFITETYNDIRLVGAPPSSIGNFGKDTDNWMWPRHTGDFSMFRIYAGKDNKPAEYAADNVPYVPKKSLSISLDGVLENDFTMVFGFPGRTQQYLHSAAVQQTMEVNNPARIAIRTRAIEVLDEFMRKDEQIKIQYSSKYAGISNFWKKWQGEVLGLNRTGAVAKKKQQESVFQQRLDKNDSLKSRYGPLLPDLSATYEEFRNFGLARDYFTEILPRIEFLGSIGSQLNSLISAFDKGGEQAYQQRLVIVRSALESVFEEFNSGVDQKLFEALIPLYINDQKAEFVSPLAKKWMTESGSVQAFSARIYEKTPFAKKETVYNLLQQPSAELLANLRSVEFLQLYQDMVLTYQEQVQPTLNELQNRLNRLQRDYMRAQMDLMKERRFYPDANSTLRVTYGKVNGYEARDAVQYDFYTYLDGVIEKYVPGDYEFDLPAKLLELYKSKDYGPYGKNGKMSVCFLGSNHTTGGNSGSPALDAYGNLVGLNFDRVWEGTMSDINYDPSICRNIMVDIRYVLFITDKFAGASHLIKEMKLVHPKRP